MKKFIFGGVAAFAAALGIAAAGPARADPQRRRDRGRVADKQRRGRCAGNANRESLMQIFEDMFGGSWSPITGCTRHPSFEQ